MFKVIGFNFFVYKTFLTIAMSIKQTTSLAKVVFNRKHALT